jgi:hypothetical protein
MIRICPLLLCYGLMGDPSPPQTPVRVTIVVVLADNQPGGVDPLLEELAREIRKREPQLRRFRIHAIEAQSILPARQGVFTLVDKQQAVIRVEAYPDEKGRARLTLTAPGIDQLTYSCVCDKYFPVVTNYRTAQGERLIVAIMAKPCTWTK